MHKTRCNNFWDNVIIFCNKCITKFITSRYSIPRKDLSSIQEEKVIDGELKARQKVGQGSSEVTTRLKNSIVSVNGKEDQTTVNDFVDKFVIIESEYTHSGKKRKLIFNINNYQKFKNKIIYIISRE